MYNNISTKYKHGKNLHFKLLHANMFCDDFEESLVSKSNPTRFDEMRKKH